MQSCAVEKIEHAARLVGYKNASRYRMRGEFLFKGICFDRKQVLEVGCGAGAWTIWAALHGAARVIGLEPEAAGSTQAIHNRLEENIGKLSLDGKIVAARHRLEDFADLESPLDVVILFNVVNHLDEDAVIALADDPGARQRYLEALRKLRARMRSDGWLVVADCGRQNFWSRMGLVSPLAPTIEWQKHQPPRVWKEIFLSSGFRLFDLRWSPIYPFPRLTSSCGCGRRESFFPGS
jgi:SAM-dependent methyltransferase